MGIIDKIRKFLKIKTTEEKLQDFISKIDFSDMVKRHVDREVTYAINNKLIGINEEIMVDNIINEAYIMVVEEIFRYGRVNYDLACKFEHIITMEVVANYIKNNILINNDYIVEAYQRFIDHNLEEVKKEDERLALELQDQFEDLDFISEKDFKKASKYDNPNFDIYNDIEGKMGYDQEIIPPKDEESDVVDANDDSIEILDEYSYEEGINEEQQDDI